jgi:uncharacterized membrane protein YedE/YeeE
MVTVVAAEARIAMGSSEGDGASPSVLVGGAAVAVIIGAIGIGVVNFGKDLFEITHGGNGAPAGARSWSSMYANMGWGVVWGVVALGLFSVSAFKRNINVTRKRSLNTLTAALIAAGLAITFGLFIATHFAHKVGVSNPW